MAKDVIIKVVCDKHRGEGTDITNAETYEVGLEGKTRTIDLCEQCASEFIDPLQELLTKYGIAVTATAVRKSHKKKKEVVAPAPAAPASTETTPASVETTPAVAAVPAIPAKKAAAELDAKGNIRKGRKTDKPHNEVCLWCPADYAATSGLIKHLEGVHGLPGGFRAVFGNRCPFDGKRYDLLGRHTTSAHNGLGVPMAFHIAREQGDPHGVVAAVLKKARVLQ